jgi:hypothetical protein
MADALASSPSVERRKGSSPLLATGGNMFDRIRAWFCGWYLTLQIKYREPELYRYLQEPIDPEDFEEVTPYE